MLGYEMQTLEPKSSEYKEHDNQNLDLQIVPHCNHEDEDIVAVNSHSLDNMPMVRY